MNGDTSLIGHVQELLAESLQVPPDMVTSDLAFGDLPQWDSLGHMEIMLRLEERFGVAVDADTIAQLISVTEICKYLEEKGYVQ